MEPPRTNDAVDPPSRGACSWLPTVTARDWRSEVARQGVESVLY
jgi:hypothetical protein